MVHPPASANRCYTDWISDGRAGSAGLSWDRPGWEPRLPIHPSRAGLRGVHLDFASVARPCRAKLMKTNLGSKATMTGQHIWHIKVRRTGQAEAEIAEIQLDRRRAPVQ